LRTISSAASSSIQHSASGCLVLSDRPPEHHALLGISGGAFERGAAEPDRFRRDQDAFGIHAVQNVFEAAAFLADAILGRHFQTVNEELIGVDGMTAHFVDDAHLDVAAIERGIEESQSSRRLAHLLGRRGAHQDQHLVGIGGSIRFFCSAVP
jgi:hypothetical protein